MKLKDIIKNFLNSFWYNKTFYRVVHQRVQYCEANRDTVDTGIETSYILTRNIITPSVKRAFNERN